MVFLYLTYLYFPIFIGLYPLYVITLDLPSVLSWVITFIGLGISLFWSKLWYYIDIIVWIIFFIMCFTKHITGKLMYIGIAIVILQFSIIIIRAIRLTKAQNREKTKLDELGEARMKQFDYLFH